MFQNKLSDRVITEHNFYSRDEALPSAPLEVLGRDTGHIHRKMPKYGFTLLRLKIRERGQNLVHGLGVNCRNDETAHFGRGERKIKRFGVRISDHDDIGDCRTIYLIAELNFPCRRRLRAVESGIVRPCEGIRPDLRSS